MQSTGESNERNAKGKKQERINVAEQRAAVVSTDQSVKVRTRLSDVDPLLGQQELEGRELQVIILISCKHVSSTDPILYLFFIINYPRIISPAVVDVIID